MARLEDLPDITAEPYKAIWTVALKRAGRKYKRTPTTEEIVEIYANLLPKFTAQDGTVTPDKKIFELPGLPYEFPEMPGLVLRKFTRADMNLIVPKMVYKPEIAERAVLARMNDPFTCILSWAYKERLVQTESLRLLPDNSAEIGTAVHMMRRTASFWREIERPVSERLAALGVTTISTLTLNRLVPYWKPIIVDFYHGKAGRVSEQTTQFMYPLDLTVFKGFAARRTAGAGWSYEANNMTFREMTDSDLPEVLEAVRGMHKVGEGIANQLEEKYVLDRGAVLLGYLKGELISVRAVRPSRYRTDRGNFSIYNRISNTIEENTARWVSHVWYKILGYKHAVIFASQPQRQASTIKAYIEHQDDAKIVSEHTENGIKTYAIEFDIEASIQRGIK